MSHPKRTFLKPCCLLFRDASTQLCAEASKVVLSAFQFARLLIIVLQELVKKVLLQASQSINNLVPVKSARFKMVVSSFLADLQSF